MKRQHRDFVNWLESQLKAFRARRFGKLDVEAVGCELEAVVGRYKYEISHRAKRLIPILMRPYRVYGDWNDLRFEWDMLRAALKDSPSLANRAAVNIKRAYKHAIVVAELHGECGWPKRCPWKTLEDLLAAVEARNAQYLALERAGDADFGGLRRAPWKPTPGFSSE
jgi:hypothetical protein